MIQQNFSIPGQKPNLQDLRLRLSSQVLCEVQVEVDLQHGDREKISDDSRKNCWCSEEAEER